MGNEQYRKEISDGNKVTGSYGYVGPDGIYRHVEYIADENGFRASIRTSEPGLTGDEPADVKLEANPVPSSHIPTVRPLSYTSLMPDGKEGVFGGQVLYDTGPPFGANEPLLREDPARFGTRMRNPNFNANYPIKSNFENIDQRLEFPPEDRRNPLFAQQSDFPTGPPVSGVIKFSGMINVN